jgi:hypothetical protein
MADYDVVVGGGSPVMVFIALKCAVDHGQTVALIDAAERLGGAWATQTYFGHEIDNGPHLLYNFNSDIRHLLAEMTRLAGVEFRPMLPQPHSNHWLHRSILEYSFSVTPTSRLHKLGRAGLAMVRKIVPGLAAPLYFEPHGGLSKLATGSASALRSCGITILAANRIDKVTAGAKDIRAKCASGDVTGRHFIGTARLLPHIESELFGGEGAINWIRYAQSYIHLMGQRQKFSYFRPFGDPLIFLAADLTGSAQPELPPGERILSINLQAGVDHRAIDAGQIRSFLLKNDLIDPADRIEAVEWETIDNPEISVSLVEMRNRKQGAVHFVHCHNKVRALSEYLLGDRLARVLNMAQL